MNLKLLQQFVDQLEWGTLVLPALLLVFIGHKVTDGHPSARGFIGGLASLFFIVLLGSQLYLQQSSVGDLITDIVLKSLVVSGMVLGCGWMVAPALACLYRYGLAAPVTALWRCIKSFLGELLRIVTGPVRFCSDIQTRRRQSLEQARMLAEGESLSKKTAAEQKRREDIRASCELLYHRHAHVLASRFPKATFDDFMLRYLGDNHPAAYVEERGRQLQESILQHVHQIDPPNKPYTIETLAEWYRATKQLIDNLQLDSRYRQVQMAQLNARYAALMQDLMETLRP